MFDCLPAYTRLLVCLLASFGLHVGVVSFAWMQGPTVAVSANVPVEVSLVRLSSSEPSIKAETLVMVPVPKVAAHNKIATKPLARPTPARKTTLVKKAVIEKPPEPMLKPTKERIEPPPEEMVCMVPQEVVAEKSLDAEASLTSASYTPEATVAIAGVGSSSKLLPVGGTATLVEASPDYRSNPLPEYPLLARRKHWEGVVWLQVEVSAMGRVVDLHLERSCGYKVLDRSASRAVRRWQFTPASRAGVPVESRVRIPVRFRLEES